MVNFIYKHLEFRGVSIKIPLVNFTIIMMLKIILNNKLLFQCSISVFKNFIILINVNKFKTPDIKLNIRMLLL